ncbi:MAG TPA: hypothetical protein VGT78_08450 [Rhizomicrobium sp.]|nr:hypothetical protein [Rhizomicrobium sp.]
MVFAMYVVLRFLSLILIVVALMLLGADIVTSLEHGGQITVRSIEQVWAILDKSGVDAFKGWAGKSFPAIYSVLALPGWAVTGVLGVILAFLFGRRAGPHEN